MGIRLTAPGPLGKKCLAFLGGEVQEVGIRGIWERTQMI